MIRPCRAAESAAMAPHTLLRGIGAPFELVLLFEDGAPVVCANGALSPKEPRPSHPQ